MRRTIQSHRLGGFTLVEVLVALAITGMLVAILMASVFYIFKVQEALRAETQDREVALRGNAWFRDVVAGCLPVEEGDVFTGTRSELSCETTRMLVPTSLPQVGPVKLSLESTGSQVSLKYQRLTSGGGEALPVAGWAASSGEFAYVDAKGEVHDAWPTTEAPDELMPQSVRLTVRLVYPEGDMMWLASVQADPWRDEQPQLPPGLNADMFK